MDSTALDVVYIPRDLREFRWDALVAIGTLALATTTALTLVIGYFQERERVRRQIIGAINYTVVQLAQTYNKFNNYYNQAIRSRAREPFRHLTIPVLLAPSKNRLKIDYRSLLFLFELGDPDLLGALWTVQEDAAAISKLILEPNRLLSEEIHPAIEKATGGFECQI